MSQRPKGMNVMINDGEPIEGAEDFAEARPDAEAEAERRAKFEAAAKAFMTKHAELLKKLAD